MKKILISFLMVIIILTLSLSSKVRGNSGQRKIIKDKVYNFEMVDVPSGILKQEITLVNFHALEVHIKSFYMGKYEVTQKLWEKVMGRNYSEVKGDNFPVTNITWHAALDFVKKLSKKTGHVYRLPTDSEWEYACRAGTTTKYYFGSDISLLDEYEWSQKNAGGKPHPVGLKKPNPWGLYDMTGNVNEWTATYWDPEFFYRAFPEDKRVFRGGYRVVRGSSFLHGRDAHFGSDYQHEYGQYGPRKYVGFRIVREKKD